MTYDPYQPPQPQLPWQQQPQSGYGYSPPSPTPPSTNGLAIASLVTSLAGLQLLGIIFGHIALGQIKRTGQGGRGLALAGVIVGYVYVGVIVILLAIAVPVFLGQQSAAQDASVKADLSNASVAVAAYGAANPGLDEVPSLTDGTLDEYGLTLGPYTQSVVATGTYSTSITLIATSTTGHRYQITDFGPVVDLG